MAEESKDDSDEEINWSKNPNMNCRFYPNELPNENDYVTGTITEISTDGCYIKLPEYNYQSAFVLFSEISRRRANHAANFAKIGRTNVYMILRVDKNKKFIDCSKIRVKTGDTEAQAKNFHKSKQFHTINRCIAFKCKMRLEEVYQMFGWPLYLLSKTAHPIDQLKDASLETEESLFSQIPMSKEVRAELYKQIKSRFGPKQVKLRADFEMTCYTKEGVMSLKKAISQAQEAVKKDKNEVLEFKFVSSPKYTCELLISDKAKGIDAITYALDIAEKAIKSLGGQYLLKNKAQIVGENEEEVKEAEPLEEEKEDELGVDESDEDT
jgi:translation initiation factor 2 subunit 1